MHNAFIRVKGFQKFQLIWLMFCVGDVGSEGFVRERLNVSVLVYVLLVAHAYIRISAYIMFLFIYTESWRPHVPLLYSYHTEV